MLLQATTLTMSEKDGLGRHVSYLTAAQKTSTMRWNFVAQPMGILSSMLGRVSFALFLLNFVGTSKARRRLLWFFIGAQILVNAVTIVAVFVQCGKKVEALWDTSVEAKCWSPVVQTNIGFGQSSKSSFHESHGFAFGTLLPDLR